MYFPGEDAAIWKLLWYFLSITIPSLIAYAFGSAKAFKELKQKAYAEIMPLLIRGTFKPGSDDEASFNRALTVVSLYGDRMLVGSVYRLVGILHDSSRGDATKTIQEILAQMRSDTQPWPQFRRRMRADEFEQLYTRFLGT